MRITMLTEDKHVSLGAALSGIDVKYLENGTLQEWKNLFQQNLLDENIAILLLTEKVYYSLQTEVDNHKKSGNAPIIVILPKFKETLGQMRNNKKFEDKFNI